MVHRNPTQGITPAEGPGRLPGENPNALRISSGDGAAAIAADQLGPAEERESPSVAGAGLPKRVWVGPPCGAENRPPEGSTGPETI
ncbi:MAG: hypothetical protein NTW51_15800 [Cyanobacteria bacterium]|nr:hypothetical protein [Cyanobacteriota bacterium]